MDAIIINFHVNERVLRMGPVRGVEEGRPYPSNLLKGLGTAYHPSVSCLTPHSPNNQFPTLVSVMEGTHSCPSRINFMQIFLGSE